MKLYKGYTKNEGKKPVEKIKGVTTFRTFEEAKQFESFGGVLADDSILIDIDDSEQSTVLMDMVEEFQLNCQVIKTKRGRHFTFKNSGVTKCGTGLKLAIGLTADVKTGEKNAVECLKIDGTERFVEWEFDESNGESFLPKWLFPVNSNTNFFGMCEGDGRDSALFSYQLVLANAGFTQEETHECIRLMNRFILKDKLSESDLKRILRDEAFPKEVFYNGKQFLFDNFARFLKTNERIIRINGQLHIFKDGCFVPGNREIESRMLKYIPNMKAAQRMEVYKYLELLCVENTEPAEPTKIAFENGVYDLITGELIPFDSSIVITNKIPWNYNAEAYSELCDNTLNKIACFDENVRMLLEECVGACFYRSNTLAGGKAFILTGEKANGKSTFLEMVKYLLGEKNVSSLDIGELDERFSTASMSGVLANIGDDISDEFLSGKVIAIFKKLVTGNAVKGEFKGLDAFFFNPYLKLLFSANDIPRMKDRTGAVMRRLVIVPFNARFSKSDPDYRANIIFDLKKRDVMEYMVRIGIEGLQRVLENKDFTHSEKVEDQMNQFEINNNPILLFTHECDISEILNQPTKDVHRLYKIFCLENGFQEMGLINFSREICRRLNLRVDRRRINGKLIGIYVKEGV